MNSSSNSPIDSQEMIKYELYYVGSVVVANVWNVGDNWNVKQLAVRTLFDSFIEWTVKYY